MADADTRRRFVVTRLLQAGGDTPPARLRIPAFACYICGV